MSESADSVVG